MKTIYQAFATKSTCSRSLKFRHFWYESPFFFNDNDAINHCLHIISHDKKYKGYHFAFVSSYTVF